MDRACVQNSTLQMRPSSSKKICAVVPAAGRGSRLQAKVPKFFIPIDSKMQVGEIILGVLQPCVHHVALVLSEEGSVLYRQKMSSVFSEDLVSVYIQENPLGMADALFCAQKKWRDYDRILVVWGDQVLIQKSTIEALMSVHDSGSSRPTVAVALTRVKNPYVEYQFSDQGEFLGILESREGDSCSESGWSDVGMFCLSTQGLIPAWLEYQQNVIPGKTTGDLNFLPFLKYLVLQKNWLFLKTHANAEERLGLNTPEDLKLIKQALSLGALKED